MDACETAAEVRGGRLSALELCRVALTRAAAAPGIFWELDVEPALAAAAAIDERVARSEETGVLAGVPVGIKDNFAVAGVPSSLGIVGRRRVDEMDAVVVRRLREAGAVVLGKTAMDTLAWSMSGQAEGFPVCENTAAPGCLTGGSSGGSAVAVAAHIVPLAIGSDTAGSARLPAAWCGVVGLKPSFGAVSLAGCAPLARSLDTVGIFSRSVRDSRLALDVIADDLKRAGRAAAHAGVLRIGVQAVPEELCRRLRAAGHSLVEISDSWPAPGIGSILAAEFAAAWGTELAGDLDTLNDSVRAGLAGGANVPPGEYQRALAACQAAAQNALPVFETVDVLALPTCDLVAPPLGRPAPVSEASRHTRAFSAYGWPAISVPAGLSDGKPLGLQLVAPPGQDAPLIDRAELITQAI